MYQVKEVFHTLQGEGARSGRAAVFCRFAGCNLWSGLEVDRASAICHFCDTEFRGTDGPGGGRFASAEVLADHILEQWMSQTDTSRETKTGDDAEHALGPAGVVIGDRSDQDSSSLRDGDWPADACRPERWRKNDRRYVVCTGGEPLLQLDAALITALHERDFEVAVETNGTLPVPEGIDWLCVSPKAGAPLALGSGDELKLVFPQPGAMPEQFAGLSFDHFFLQPMDGPRRREHSQRAVAYCRRHPQWRLSLQLHKLLGIP